MYTNLGLLLENIESIIYVAELDNGFWLSKCVGAPLKSLTGFNENDFLSRKINLLDIIHDSDKSTVASTLNKTNFSPKMISHQYRIIRKDGSTVWVQDIRKLYFEDDKILVKGIILNINDRKKLEAENFELYSALVERNAELQEAISSISNLNMLMRSKFKLFEEGVILKLTRTLIPKIRNLQDENNVNEIVDIITDLLDVFQTIDEEDSLDSLSKRETEVAISVRIGLTHKEIADDFNISVDTVKTHVKNIKRKLSITKDESLHSRLKNK